MLQAHVNEHLDLVPLLTDGSGADDAAGNEHVALLERTLLERETELEGAQAALRDTLAAERAKREALAARVEESAAAARRAEEEAARSAASAQRAQHELAAEREARAAATRAAAAAAEAHATELERVRAAHEEAVRNREAAHHEAMAEAHAATAAAEHEAEGRHAEGLAAAERAAQRAQQRLRVMESEMAQLAAAHAADLREIEAAWAGRVSEAEAAGAARAAAAEALAERSAQSVRELTAALEARDEAILEAQEQLGAAQDGWEVADTAGREACEEAAALHARCEELEVGRGRGWWVGAVKEGARRGVGGLLRGYQCWRARRGIITACDKHLNGAVLGYVLV
jgi:hypothetical protein